MNALNKLKNKTTDLYIKIENLYESLNEEYYEYCILETEYQLALR